MTKFAAAVTVSLLSVLLILLLGSSSSSSSSAFATAFQGSTTRPAAAASSPSTLSSASSFASYDAISTPPSSARMPLRSWTCHGRHQRELCQNLRAAGIIRSDAVYQVMKDTDRQLYMSSVQQQPAWHAQHDCPVYYVDAPYAIGMGQTISAPHMHAHVLEDMLPHLLVQPTVSASAAASQPPSSSLSSTSHNMRLLDVGCGSGYLTACLGRWCRDPSYMGRTGRVFGIDIRTALVDRTRRNIKSDDASLMFYDADDNDNVASPIIQLETANGWNGHPAEAPFDGIHVGAAAASFPKVLAMQLKLGGVMIVPIGPDGGTQGLYKVIRERLADQFYLEDFFITKLLDVRYVPLVQSPVALAP